MSKDIYYGEETAMFFGMPYEFILSFIKENALKSAKNSLADYCDYGIRVGYFSMDDLNPAELQVIHKSLSEILFKDSQVFSWKAYEAENQDLIAEAMRDAITPTELLKRMRKSTRHQISKIILFLEKDSEITTKRLALAELHDLPPAEASSELICSCQLLKGRLSILSAPGAIVNLPEWETLKPPFQSLIPSWIKCLLNEFPFKGVVLEGFDARFVKLRSFRLLGPEDYEALSNSCKVSKNLIAQGLLPFAGDVAGNLWALSGDFSASSEVYHVTTATWNSAMPPSISNGVILASKRLSLLLASMSISEATYYADDGAPHSLLWQSTAPPSEQRN